MDQAPPPPPIAGPTLKRRPRWKALFCGGCLGLFVLGLIGISLSIAGLSSLFSGLGGFTEDEVTETYLSGSGDNKIAVISLHGIILTDGPSGDGNTYARSIEIMAQKALDDANVKAVVMDIDSPGGGVSASALIYDAFQKIRAEKPVVAFYSGDVAASGGVYVSMAAQKIVSYKEVLTGSIGVIMEFPEFGKLLETYGVQFNTIRSGRLKDIGTPYRAMTDEERQLLQGFVDETYEGFVQVVSNGRHLSVSQVKEFADGRVFSAATAKNLGMVDEIGDLERVETLAKELAGIDEAQMVKYEQPVGFGSFFSSYLSQVGQPAALAILQEMRRTPSTQLFYLME